MNLYDLIINDKRKVLLEDVFLDDISRNRIMGLIKEHRYVEELHRYGLPVNNKLLLHGSSGCGKTTTAMAIAHTLDRPIFILNLSNVVSARIGETSQHLKMVFDKAGREGAVLFLDEFDQIGKERDSDDREVGEMRRLVNTLIQMIDYYPEKALLICATNHAEVLDSAIMRRFQLRIGFEMPDRVVLDQYYDKILAHFPAHLKEIRRQYDISFAEAKDYAYTSVKSSLIAELEARQVVEAD